VTRHGEKIEQYPLRNTVNTGIQYNTYFEGIRAAIVAGATLDELNKWVDGGYPQRFMATVVAWYRADGLITRHSDQAVAKAIEQMQKRKRGKQ
jgi:hypothetical protein